MNILNRSPEPRRIGTQASPTTDDGMQAETEVQAEGHDDIEAQAATETQAEVHDDIEMI